MGLTKERYEIIARWISSRPRLLRLIRSLNQWLPAVMYAAYPLLLLYLAAGRDGRFLRVLLVPAGVFAVVTALRSCLNFPRPYEKLSVTPLIGREGAGRSFPSRHASSAAVIAAAFWFIWPPAGAALAVIALTIALIRTLAGLHFIKDAAAGLLFGLAAAITGFWLIL